ncbi:MAG TPA: transposase, partial [Candidatus Limnocylindrales bacterium]|nr:transposase [Candidatus Limnocylindrales bacterium]
MSAIGIDTHKDSLAACAVDELGGVVAEATFANDPAGHERLGRWAGEVAPGARLGFEGSSTYGAAAARTLDHAGFEVCEVPPQLSRRERLRTRRAGKSDSGDALAIARV